MGYATAAPLGEASGVAPVMAALSSMQGQGKATLETESVSVFHWCLVPKTLTVGQPIFAKRPRQREVDAARESMKQAMAYRAVVRDVGPGTTARDRKNYTPIQRFWTLQCLNSAVYDLQCEAYARNPPEDRHKPLWKTAFELLDDHPVLFYGFVTKITVLNRQPDKSYMDSKSRQRIRLPDKFRMGQDEMLCTLEIVMNGVCPKVLNQFDSRIVTSSPLYVVLKQVDIDAQAMNLLPPAQAIDWDGYQAVAGEMKTDAARGDVEPSIYLEKPRKYFKHLIDALQPALDPVPSTKFWQFEFLAGSPGSGQVPTAFIQNYCMNEFSRTPDLECTVAVFFLGLTTNPNVRDVNLETTTYDKVPVLYKEDTPEKIIYERVTRVRWLRAVTHAPYNQMDEPTLLVYTEGAICLPTIWSMKPGLFIPKALPAIPPAIPLPPSTATLPGLGKSIKFPLNHDLDLTGTKADAESLSDLPASKRRKLNEPPSPPAGNATRKLSNPEKNVLLDLLKKKTSRKD